MRYRWFFRPEEGSKPDREADPVAEDKFLQKLQEERLKELHVTRDKLKAIRPKERTLMELQEAFKAGLAALNETAREDMGFELDDLNLVMGKMKMPSKMRFNMFVDFVENKIDPGLVREVGLLLNLQMGEAGVHPLRTAEHYLMQAKKDSRQVADTKFRDALLDRLAMDRRQRTGKEFDYCKIVILEGDEWTDEEYQRVYGKKAMAAKQQ